MTETTSTSRSARVMVTTSNSPVSVSREGRQNSTSTAESESTLVTEESHTDHQVGRGARVRMPAAQATDSRTIVIPGQTYPTPRDVHSSSLRFADRGSNEIPNSSDEEDMELRYGRHLRNYAGSYAFVPPTTSAIPPRQSSDSTVLESDSARQESDFHSFIGRFRSLIDQVTRETDEGIALAYNDEPTYRYSEHTPPSPVSSRLLSVDEEDDDKEYIFSTGHYIQRMPTIASVGSREAMSLGSSARGDRSVHTLSRPPTRSNTLMTDGSQSPSRRNSLNPAIALSSPVEGSFNLDGFVSELGELGGSSSQQSTKSPELGSKSTASYYTANSAHSPIDGPSESSWPSANQPRNCAR